MDLLEEALLTERWGIEAEASDLDSPLYFASQSALSSYDPPSIRPIEFMRSAWRVLEPGNPLHLCWMHELLLEYLEATLSGQLPSGKRNLLVNVAPRSLKSTIASVIFPAWTWTQNPSSTFLCLSYSTQLAIDHNSNRRTLIQSDWYQELTGGKIALELGKNRLSEFANQHRGYMIARGLDGSVTGVGAGTCLTGEVLISTDHGNIPIALLVQLQDPPKVLSFSHDSKSFEYKRIKACKVSRRDELIEFEFKGGETVRCTPEHRFYIEGKGYISAQDISRSDQFKRIEGDRGCPILRSMWSLFRKTVLRVQEAGSKRHNGILLRQRLFLDSETREDKREKPTRALEVAGLPSGAKTQMGIRAKKRVSLRSTEKREREACEASDSSYLQNLRDCIQNKELQSRILFSKVFKQSTFFKDERIWQLEIQRWFSRVFEFICKNETISSGEGLLGLCGLRQALRGLRKRVSKRCGSPHEQRSFGQHPRESSVFVSFLPQKGTHGVTATAIRRINREAELVYDIEVEGNHNFFANGVLTHNCLIFDDPENPEKQVRDPEVRKRHLQKVRSYMTNRRNSPDTPIIVVQQRCDLFDTSQHILEHEREDYEILIIPQLEERPTHYVFPLTQQQISRQRNEPIDPARYPLTQVLKDKETMGAAVFEARHQQRPIPSEGEIIKLAQFKRYAAIESEPLPHLLDRLHIELTILSLDAAATKGRGSSNWAFLLGGIDGQRNLYLLECHAERYRYPEGKARLYHLAEQWQPDLILIENKSSGIQLSQECTNLPIITTSPESDKVTRAEMEAALIAAGRVYLPERSQGSEAIVWLSDFETEIRSFPGGIRNDRVDALTQLLKWVRQSNSRIRRRPVGSVHYG